MPHKSEKKFKFQKYSFFLTPQTASLDHRAKLVHFQIFKGLNWSFYLD